MTTNQHGGPRPAVREDDGRRNNRPTVQPGRKPKSFTLKLGDAFAKQEANADGYGVLPSQVWTVIEITRTHVKFQTNDGETVRLIR